MSVCASGISQARPGVPAGVIVDQAYMQNLLPQPWSFLYPYLPYMHVLEIGDVAAFCSLDPPTYTLPSALEFLSFVTGGNLGQGLVVKEFFDKLVKSYLWYSLCQCSTGSPTAHPSPLSDPGDLPSVNPAPYVSLPANGACASFTGVVSNVDSSHSYIPIQASFPGVIPKVAKVRISKAITIGAGATSNHHLIQYSVVLGGSGSVLKDEFVTLGPANSGEWNILMMPGAQFMQVQANYLSGSGSSSVTSFLDLYCGDGLPGAPAQPCCPPDPGIIKLLNQIVTTVSLIQRQNVPFAYLVGTEHTGLTGNGSFGVSSLIGLQLDLTVIPDRAGRATGSTDALWDVGYVELGSGDGWFRRERIQNDRQLVFPVDMGLVTVVGYTLPADVVLTIRELVREP